MKRKVKFISVAVFINLILGSCATTHLDSGIPAYSQKDEIYLKENIKLKVGEAYWTNTIQFQKADAAFLVVEMSVVNMDKKTTVIAPPSFTLVNSQGYEYEISYRGIAGGGPDDNLIEKLTVDRLSPLIPIKGKIVFDVPKGNYTLIVSTGEKDMKTGAILRIKDLAKFELTPIDK